MDIKAVIEDLVSKITKDSGLKEKFQKDPAGTVQGLAKDLPTDQIADVVKGVTAKIGAKDIGEKIGGGIDAIGGLFGKK